MVTNEMALVSLEINSQVCRVRFVLKECSVSQDLPKRSTI